MPEKLKRCVQHVKDQGKSEDSAWAICVDSTGLKPHKKKKKEVKKMSAKDKKKEVKKAIKTLSDPVLLKVWKEYAKSLKTDEEIESERAMAGGGRGRWEAREKKRKYQNPENEEDVAKSEQTGIPEIDSPIHREPKKPSIDAQVQSVEPQSQPNMRTRPRRQTMQEAEEEEQFKRDFEDRDTMDEQHDSDYAIDREAREEMEDYASDEETAQFLAEAKEQQKKMSPEAFSSWMFNVVGPRRYAGFMHDLGLTPRRVEGYYEPNMDKAWKEFIEKSRRPYRDEGPSQADLAPPEPRKPKKRCQTCGEIEPCQCDRDSLYSQPTPEQETEWNEQNDMDKAWLPYKEWKAKQEKEKGEKKDKKKKKK
jgi:hypothetical protein